MAAPQLLLGCDPEVFLVEPGSNNPISAFQIVPGTKKEPYRVACGTVQVDGLAAEIGIDPVTTETQWVFNIHNVMSGLQDMVYPYHLKLAAIMEFAPFYMDTRSKMELELGCDPDYNAYTENENPRPDQHPTMRTAAGHIHFGWTNEADPLDTKHRKSCFALVKQLDFFLGLPSVLLDPDTKRKEMYGKAGCCRIKHYGTEYRTLSNFWLTTPSLTAWAFKNSKAAFDMLTGGRWLYQEYGDVCEAVINNNDKAEAERLIKEIGIGME